MPNSRSRSKRAEEMFRVVERYHHSGLTQKRFCKSEGFALSTLQFWISRYKKQKRQNQQNGSSIPAAFMELKPQSPVPSSNNAIVLSYPSGVTLTLHKDVELSLLKELITL
jgi:transposase-like protein